MSTLVDVSQTTGKQSAGTLTGTWQRVAMAAWAVVFLLSLLSSVLSIAHLNLWDRMPAADLLKNFPDMSSQDIASRANFLTEVTGLGFSLPVFANLLTAFRVVGSLSLFILSVLLVRRYPRILMGLVFAGILAVMGAAGIWQNTLFGWATMLAPWMEIPTQVLNILLWFGIIFLYAFPDGHFTPRWTVGLVILLIPMVIAMIFDLPIFLNPGTWPGPLPLLPNLVFIGVAFFSVLYRYNTAEPAQKARLRGWVMGVSMLMILYFILFFMNDVYEALSGQTVFKTTRDLVIYILINEPLWYLLEVAFVVLTARSLFRDRLLEG